ncbi:MAG: hypothetical protein R3F43_17890 [bacterium]
MVIYKSTMNQAQTYIRVLERINAVGMAVQILTAIDHGPAERDAALVRVAEQPCLRTAARRCPPDRPSGVLDLPARCVGWPRRSPCAPRSSPCSPCSRSLPASRSWRMTPTPPIPGLPISASLRPFDAWIDDALPPRDAFPSSPTPGCLDAGPPRLDPIRSSWRPAPMRPRPPPALTSRRRVEPAVGRVPDPDLRIELMPGSEPPALDLEFTGPAPRGRALPPRGGGRRGAGR